MTGEEHFPHGNVGFLVLSEYMFHYVFVCNMFSDITHFRVYHVRTKNVKFSCVT